MLFAKQVIDGLYGVECGQRHFDKYGYPFGHSSVPETR